MHNLAHLRPPLPDQAWPLVAHYRADPATHLGAMLRAGLFVPLAELSLPETGESLENVLQASQIDVRPGDVFVDAATYRVLFIALDGSLSLHPEGLGRSLGLPVLDGMGRDPHEIGFAEPEIGILLAAGLVRVGCRLPVSFKPSLDVTFRLDGEQILRILLLIFRDLSAHPPKDPQKIRTVATYLPDVSVDGTRNLRPTDAACRDRRIVHLRACALPAAVESLAGYRSAPSFRIRGMLAQGTFMVQGDHALITDAGLTAAIAAIATRVEIGDVFIDADSLEVCLINLDGQPRLLENRLGDLCGMPDLDALAEGPHQVQFSPDRSGSMLRVLGTVLDQDLDTLDQQIAEGYPVAFTARNVVDLMLGFFAIVMRCEGTRTLASQMSPIGVLDPVDDAEPTERAGAKRPREMKMWLAVRHEKGHPAEDRKPLHITRPKLAGQAMHAAHWLTYLVMRTRPDLMEAYHGGPFAEGEQPPSGTPKIVVKAKNLAMLERIEREARAAGIPCVSVTDEGRTEFDGPTKTVVAFGPAYEDELPKYLADLQFLKDPVPDAQAGTATG